MWLLVFFIHGLFEIQTLRRYTTLLFNLVSSMLVNLLVAITYFYFQPNLILTPRRFLLIEIVVAFVLLLFWHMLVKYFVKNRLVEWIYLFSFNNELSELEQEIKGQSFLGYKVLGHLSEADLDGTNFARNSGVILPDVIKAHPEVISKFYKLRTHGVRFYNTRDFYEQLLRRVYLSQLNEIWFLENINYKEKRFYNLVKRAVDLVFGFFSFFVFLVTFPFVALAIKLDSPGPALFTQERVGKNGGVFKIYKYRTMNTVSGKTWTEKNDPRITRLGNILRKTRIDELPQSINLILGDLSLVGPRPEQVQIVEQLRSQIPFYDERHLVKPGITGWSQLNIYAGSLEETRLKLQYDLYYIKHRSFLFDLEIILKTIYYIFTWQGR
jgi:exopolysaccharide biosynthesis polyprenyl glycosylphosphotransferase